MELDLEGRRALITGGSRGIGLACAHGLAAEGVDLAIAARTVEPLKDATRELRAEYDVDVTSHSCDLGRPDHQEALADVVGPVDILVNATGAIAPGDLGEIDDEAWRRAWDLKVYGTINLCRLILPRMLERRSGVIVNLIGAEAVHPRPDRLAGSAGAAALVATTRALGADAATRGVRVVGVNPAIPPRPTAAGAEDRLSDEAADQVADVVVFLASDRASMVSGTVITVDGGASGR